MKTIVKTYEISYILGTVNPEEKKIRIDTINQLTEPFIRDEIEKKHPNYKGFIGSILSVILVGEKVIGETIEEKPKDLKDKDKIPVFNW